MEISIVTPPGQRGSFTIGSREQGHSLEDLYLRLRRHVSLLFMDPAEPYHWMAIQGVVVKTVDEDDPIHGNMATESINAMSQSYLGESTYPLRDPAGGEVRSLYRVRPNRAQLFGHA
jgi:hypothetical protein